MLVESPAIAEILSLLRQTNARTAKNGSKLSLSVYNALNVVSSTLSMVAEEEISSIDTQTLSQCSDLLRRYADVMRDHKMNNQLHEVTYVQPHSYQLIKDLFEVMIPQYYDRLQFIWKEKVLTNYGTSIKLSDEKWVDVKGETDISVYYRDVCIFVWEDKNLSNTLNTPEEMCQIVVEVKGFAEKFKSTIGVEAQQFSGVETSGLVWTFCSRYFNEGTTFAFDHNN